MRTRRSTGPWRRRTILLVVAGTLVPLVAAQAQDPLEPYLGDPGRTLPNIVPNVETVQIQTYRPVGGGFEQGLFLWFDTRAQNLGTVPVQLTVDDIESPEVSTVTQCVSWRSPEAHLCRRTEPAGGFVWHQEHEHFHYEDFAAYQLRRLAADGRPDYSDGGLVRSSDKVSFCLIDSARAREDTVTPPFYETCLPTVQGITPGWADVYSASTEGQNFPIAGVSDGLYALTIDLNHDHTLRETSYDDNFIEVTLRIADNLSSVQVLGKRWPPPNDRGAPTTTMTTVKKPKKPKHDG